MRLTLPEGRLCSMGLFDMFDAIADGSIEKRLTDIVDVAESKLGGVVDSIENVTQSGDKVSGVIDTVEQKLTGSHDTVAQDTNS